MFFLPGSLLLLANAMHLPYLGDLYSFLPRLLEAELALSGLGYCLIPPCILVFAASGRGGADFAGALTIKCLPLRIVHLLNFKGAHNPLAREVVEQLGYRTYDEDDSWQRPVDALAEIVPFILMDCRTITTHILYEIQHILSNGLEQKTLFISDERQNAIALSFIDGALNVHLNVATAEDVAKFVPECAWSYFWRSKTPLYQSVLRVLGMRGRLFGRTLAPRQRENSTPGASAIMAPLARFICEKCGARSDVMFWANNVNSVDMFFALSERADCSVVACCLDCGGAYCGKCLNSFLDNCPHCGSHLFAQGIGKGEACRET